jgi:hypothetical protein
MNTSEAASAATPRTIWMDRDTFYLWLREVQRLPVGATPDEPAFLLDEIAELPESPYALVEAYLETTEGTVIAWHERHSNRVKVVLRNEKPCEGLMRTVRMMLDEESEAA